MRFLARFDDQNDKLHGQSHVESTWLLIIYEQWLYKGN